MARIELGMDLKSRSSQVVIDPLVLADNCLVLGAQGSGKTTLGRVLLEQAQETRIPALFVDTTGDLTSGLMDDAGIPLERGLPDHRPGGALQLRSVDADIAAGIFLEPRSGLGEGDSEELLDLSAALLGVLGYRARKRAPEALLITTIVEQRWRAGSGVSLDELIPLVLRPPVERLGAFGLERVISSDRREDLAGAIDGLLRSPSFSDLGEPRPLLLDLLLGDESTPIATVLSFADRSPSIRRFIVATLLAKLKRQESFPSGGGLKFLLYFDEGADFLPRGERTLTSAPLLDALLSWSNPDVGLVLVAESPEDLHEDVEDLCGTWFVGRMPVSRSRRTVVEALDLVDPPVDEVALEKDLRILDAGQFILRTGRLDELQYFEIRP